MPEEEQPRSFRGAARGCSRAWARGANTVSRAAGPLLRRGPHSATLRKALHAHEPRRGRVPWYHHLKTLNPAFLVRSGPCRLCRGFWPRARGSGHPDLSFQFPKCCGQHFVPGLFRFPLRDIASPPTWYMGYQQTWETGSGS